ncbi:MAG: NAD(P)/FAD-dependent oxidoreductase [Saprospiraceae bacterium]|jgi:sulfide:quinone oxidoreductase|nr:NAD(P)/FAD-dependent oxidoreductase [Saprospiraceae bacterium]
MKKVVIIGAGTGGTIMAQQLNKELDNKNWSITIIDERKEHYYQPGFLFLPFDQYKPEDVVKPIKDFIPKGVDFLNVSAAKILPEDHQVILSNGNTLQYDILIVATGTEVAPEEIEGMQSDEWGKSVFTFYTYEGAVSLRDKLRDWKGGKLVVHITEMPIKCPVAPLEFAFLADSFFKDKKMRDKVEITYVTPLSGAFTKPKATETLEYLLKEKNIHIESDFAIESVDNENKTINDYGGKSIPFDLLVTVPTNKGREVVEISGMGDDLNFIPTDKGTLQSKKYPDVFVIGDATNVPTSKAGSVVHFEAEILTENILSYIKGKEMTEQFDGHANCFIETGGGKALLIDFNYDHEPVTGTFPIAGIGPLRLLKESRFNHFGKLAFRWVYWNMLLKARPIPFVTARMNEAGKDF